MVRVFATRIIPVEHFIELVSRSEFFGLYKKYRQLFTNDLALQRSFLGQRLAEFVLQSRYKIPSEQIVIQAGSGIKPYVKDADHVHFSISHSGDWVVIATGNAPVGIDIEKIRGGKFPVAQRFFSDDEIQFLRGKTGKEADLWFFKLWTAKESYLKMTGTGLKRALSTFSIVEKDEQLHVQDSIYPENETIVVFVSYQLSNEYLLTVCSPEKEIKIVPEILQADDLLQ